jgi:diguanylate cyclase (GGDEF)-like protein/PAS domain S-box-containing protein
MMTKRPMRILVADDEPTSRLLMRATLAKSGFEPVLAVDGQDALTQFRAGPCDMVMLDVEMPLLDGFQVCAALRAEVGPELPIVMVTGMDDVDSIERAYQSGATDFIAKPINWSLIGHRVKYLFRSYDAMSMLRASLARNDAILKAIPDLMFELDLEGRFLDFHSPDSSLLVIPLERLLGNTVAQTLPPEAAEICVAALQEADEKGISVGRIIKLPHAAGIRWFELSVAGKATDPGRSQRFIVLARDISEHKEAEKRITRLAYFDSLTGLPNRQSFLERLEREVTRNRREDRRLAVLFMDLDGFKKVNDTMGHGTGDLILQWAADRLRQSTRPSDLVSRVDSAAESELARLGGDEFTVLLPNLDQSENALIVAHRIREAMRRPFHLEGREVVLTTSIGIALCPDDGESADVLLKHADTAMYHAKEQGRDNCQFYSASLTQHAMQRMNLESDLRLAVERNEFFLHYQPQLDLDSGRIRSVEALIRWQHPTQGLVSPMSFIPVAEENGLIVPIGEWVLRTACSDAAAWLAAGHELRVAVNLSPLQFRHPGLVQTVQDILDATGLPPELLELEVTEGALMEDSEITLATLNALRSRGMHLSLDDFGTGYSSMSYLTRLPLNNLKVDQSFVRNLPHDKESLAIVRAIVSLAKAIGLTVTAEGIEDLAQARVLQSFACEMLQGYYISKPIPAQALLPLLNRHWQLDAVAA